MKATLGSYDRNYIMVWNGKLGKFERYPPLKEDRVAKFLKKHDSLNNITKPN